jgi:hypothetical protein
MSDIHNINPADPRPIANEGNYDKGEEMRLYKTFDRIYVIDYSLHASLAGLFDAMGTIEKETRRSIWSAFDKMRDAILGNKPVQLTARRQHDIFHMFRIAGEQYSEQYANQADYDSIIDDKCEREWQKQQYSLQMALPYKYGD